jgi:predicted dehydrogenase
MIEIDGTEGSIAYSTHQPKQLKWMDYTAGAEQAWNVLDLGPQSAYPTITGGIFEFGFSDAILQMWAAFLDELAHGADAMSGPFGCATPAEATATHRLFTAALAANASTAAVAV